MIDISYKYYDVQSQSVIELTEGFTDVVSKEEALTEVRRKFPDFKEQFLIELDGIPIDCSGNFSYLIRSIEAKITPLSARVENFRTALEQNKSTLKFKIPDNYKLIVYVNQFNFPKNKVSFERVPTAKQPQQITDFLHKDINRFRNNSKVISILFLVDEFHVLRLLRHVRECVDKIKLSPANIEIYFDDPNSSEYIKNEIDTGGDLLNKISGNFFNRGPELF